MPEEPVRGGVLTVNGALLAATRLSPIAARDRGRIVAGEVLALLLVGAIASLLTNVARFRLGIPGSSIVFAAFPMALGFALVPRRGGGTVMAGGALLTTALLWMAGGRLDGVGAQTSLLLTGPLLDVALRRAGRGWRLYGAFVLACTAGNAAAFLVRASVKAYAFAGAGRGGGRGGGLGGGRAFDQWLPQAVWTYAAAGLLAGLISAAVWFHHRGRGEPRVPAR
jgi:hypothetical protein